MDWYEEDGLNVVPVLFESEAAVHAARQVQPHLIANARKQSIEVFVGWVPRMHCLCAARGRNLPPSGESPSLDFRRVVVNLPAA